MGPFCLFGGSLDSLGGNDFENHWLGGLWWFVFQQQGSFDDRSRVELQCTEGIHDFICELEDPASFFFPVKQAKGIVHTILENQVGESSLQRNFFGFFFAFLMSFL